MSREPDLPPLLDLVVEVGMVRMGTMVGPTRDTAYVPRLFLVVEHDSGMILSFEMVPPSDDYLPAVVEALNQCISAVRGLPRQIQMRDIELAPALREATEPFGIEVVVRESLPALDEAASEMTEFGPFARKPKPGLFDVEGMTLDHVIAFAEAAKQFYEAAPWNQLIDDDLIEIESPQGPKGTRFTQVLGAGGRSFGLGFVGTRKAHEDIRSGAGLPRGGLWNLGFESIDDIPFDDGEAWQQHGLPVASPDAYPAFLRFTKSKHLSYPTPDELAWAEGLLRALAATTEDELDRGRWEKQVQTHAGPATYKLSLPILLEQMAQGASPDPARELFIPDLGMESMMRAIAQKLARDQADHPDAPLAELQSFKNHDVTEFVPTNDAERAQALAYQAWESRGRRQVQLAREALKIDPDCCDALLILAERVSDPDIAVERYRRAVEAGERKLGPQVFNEDAGHFWGILETRPYMRARQGLAMTLCNMEEYEQAADHLRDMLRLNPGDNQGNRYILAQCLLHANRLDELDELLNRSDYHDDFTAEWAFTRALLEYRRQGDSPQGRSRLGEAVARNKHVAPLLTGRVPMPPFEPQSYSPGQEDEAIVCVHQICEGWQQTDGAIEWLDKIARPRKPSGKRRKR